MPYNKFTLGTFCNFHTMCKMFGNIPDKLVIVWQNSWCWRWECCCANIHWSTEGPLGIGSWAKYNGWSIFPFSINLCRRSSHQGYVYIILKLIQIVESFTVHIWAILPSILLTMSQYELSGDKSVSPSSNLKNLSSVKTI